MYAEMRQADFPTDADFPHAGQPEIDRLKRFRLLAAALAAAAGVAILAGWTFNLGWLIAPVGGMSAANPLAAVAILLAASALTLGPRRRPGPVRLLAALLVGAGAIRLTGLLPGFPFQIDGLLFADRLDIDGGVTHGHMTPGGAISLVLLGAALLLSCSRNRRASHLAQSFCAAVGAIALFALVGYALDLVALGGVIRIQMSCYAALAFLVLAAGTASVSAETGMTRLMLDRRGAGTLARSALPFALLAAVLLGTEDGTPLRIFTNLLVTAALVAGCVFALHRADRLRRRRELAGELSQDYFRHAEKVGHIGHWRAEAPSGEVRWSDEVYAIYGLPRSTTPSLEAKLAICHPDDREASRETMRQAMREGHGWEVHHRIVRSDGEVRYVKSHGVSERDGQGAITGVFGVLIDTTDLEFARREAEAATASKAAFLANMSHEIRTPMNGVMGFVELLMDSKLDAKQRRHLVLVQESATALLKLLNDILDLSKMEAGQSDLSAEPSNVRHDITQCVRLMTPAAEQKGLEMQVLFADDFPDNVLIDSLRFRQVLFNLLGNAVKFTKQGKVSVTLAEERGPTGKRTIQVKVADTGVGIAEERKAAIFDAFVQADASVSRRFGGSGLGLSISRSLAGLMGGAIALESEENRGTVVTLTLPLDEVFAPALTAIGPPPEYSVSGPVAEKRARRRASILLVEDIDINQELITEMLNRLGHRVDIAGNGAEALALAGRLETEPNAWDMILMDVQMPVMDGLSATRAIRALGGRAARIPIVALTANAFATEMQACRDAGMDDHIAKPSGFAQLKQVVELWGDVARSPAPPTGFGALDTVSIADRFETRLRKSTERLIELNAELARGEDDAAMQLLREAAGIAHVLAGTAGMFGRGPLGKVAQETEAELKAISREEPIVRTDNAAQAIDRLVAALRSVAGPVEPISKWAA